jgi:hypothetical protein
MIFFVLFFFKSQLYVTIVHDTLMVSPGASVVALNVDSAIMRGPAAAFEAVPLARARPLTVIVALLMLVRTGVVSVNWHVPDDGAVPSLTIEQTVAGLVWTKLFVESKVPEPLNCPLPAVVLTVITEPPA